MREAELYVKHFKVNEADKILEDLEDYCEIAMLETPKKAIFFRINTQRYLIIDDIKNPSSYSPFIGSFIEAYPSYLAIILSFFIFSSLFL